MTVADIQHAAPLRALLPPHWEYHFAQGPLESGPAPGIGEIYPGQTYNCWFHVPSLFEIQSVHDFLKEVIEDEGPFDMAWGFSAVRITSKSYRIIHSHLLPSPSPSPSPPPSSTSSSTFSPLAFSPTQAIHERRDLCKLCSDFSY